jgi:hypothetical protein
MDKPYITYYRQHIKDMDIGEEFFLSPARDSYKAVKRTNKTYYVVGTTLTVYFTNDEIGYFKR